MKRSSRPNHAEEIKVLTKSPSVELWEIEIGKVLSGKRDFIVDRLGGVQEYVEVVMAESTDEALSRVAFSQALNSLVQQWQPARPESEYYFAAMLTLISAFSPPVGFGKVLGHIKRYGHFGTNTIGPTLGQDLHLKALKVLQNYFQTPPAYEADAPGFRPYIDMLRGQLKDSKYSGHALRRLIELKALRTNDQEIVDAIRSNVDGLKELISYFLSPDGRPDAPRDLAQIYMVAASTGENVDRVFAEAARSCRAGFEALVPPIISLEDGEVITFYFTAEEMEEYTRLYSHEDRVYKIATAIINDPQALKATELTRILEDTLDRSDEELKQFVKAIRRSGLYLAPGEAGPYLYLPHEVEIPLRLPPHKLEKYMLRLRFGEEPIRAVQRFQRHVRTAAAGKD